MVPVELHRSLGQPLNHVSPLKLLPTIPSHVGHKQSSSGLPSQPTLISLHPLHCLRQDPPLLKQLLKTNVLMTH